MRITTPIQAVQSTVPGSSTCCKSLLQGTGKLLQRCFSVLSSIDFYVGDLYSEPGYHKLRSGREIFVITLPASEKANLISFLIERHSFGVYTVSDCDYVRDGTMVVAGNSRPDLRSRYITKEPSLYFPEIAP